MSIIAVDFDGTCVTHDFPEVGKEVRFCVEVLNALVLAGHQLILWTMRDGEFLDAAVAWYAERNIPLFGINENPQQKEWTASRKAYAHIYIDDAAAGCPLFRDPDHPRPYVDWSKVYVHLSELGLFEVDEDVLVEEIHRPTEEKLCEQV